MEVFNVTLVVLLIGGLMVLTGLYAISNYRRGQKLTDLQQRFDEEARRRRFYQRLAARLYADLLGARTRLDGSADDTDGWSAAVEAGISALPTFPDPADQ